LSRAEHAAVRRSIQLSGKALGWALSASAALSWAAYLVLSRAGTDAGLRPIDFALLRYGGAALVLTPFALRRGSAAILRGLGLARAIVLTLCAGPLFVATSTGAYHFAPLAHGAVAQPSSATVGALFLAALMLGERLSFSRLIGVGILLTGIVLVALNGDALGAAAGPTWLGDLLFVSAGLLWSTYSVLLGRWRVDPLQGATAVSVLSALVVIPVYVASADTTRLLGIGMGPLLIQFLVHGALAGALAVVAYGRAVAILGAGGAAPFQAVVPALAIFLGIPALGEIPTPAQVLGLGIACLGLLVAAGFPPVFRLWPTRSTPLR
jgi:drug/metabolite transporter (DMT)-like permease